MYLGQGAVGRGVHGKRGEPITAYNGGSDSTWMKP